MKTVFDFLKKTGTYYIATAEGKQPRVRPFGTINLFEDKLYIQSGRKKDVAKQIKSNPKVELSAFDGETWIRVAATLVEDKRPEPQESMFQAYPQLRERYGDGSSIIYYLKNATAVFSSFKSEPKVVKF